MMATQYEIIVVGLGTGTPGQLTQETMELLQTGRVFLRTRVHPAIEFISESTSWPSFDTFYERSQRSDDVCSEIIEALLTEAKQGPVVYAVPGHPLFGDATVRRLLEMASARSTTVRIVPAVSFLDSMVAVLKIDPVHSNVQLVDAISLAAVTDSQPYAGGLMPLSPLRPVIVAQIHSATIASAVKRTLMQMYPDDFEVTLVTSTGMTSPDIRLVPLVELDGQRVDHLSSLYLPALDPLSDNRVPEGLQRIVAQLRAPGGCPWDREQTHTSLTRHMLEEAYEAIQAIEDGSTVDLAEELGDVLLQVYLHAQIAQEAGDFALEDVIEALSTKLVRRHPHVFGDRAVESSNDVIKVWDQIKQGERADRDEPVAESPFRSIPMSLPALARAQTILRRARSHEFKIDADQMYSSDHYDAEKRVAAQLAKVVYDADSAGVDAEQALRRWGTTFVQNVETESRHHGS